jgi:uncharacterized protein (DUF983 family)
MKKEEKPKPNFFWSLLTLRCPRCRRGDMFKNKNPYKKLNLSYILDMYDHCPVCRQKFDLEPGFWVGTSYVSYGLLVAFSTSTFLFWWVVAGFSIEDYRIFYWVVVNALLIIFLLPWIMRVSRFLYLSFFVNYNANYENEEPVKFG